MNISNLVQRTKTSFVLVTLYLACSIANQYTFALIHCALILLLTKEFCTLALVKNYNPSFLLTAVNNLLIFVITFLYASGLIPQKSVLFFIPILLNPMIFELFRKQETPFENITFSILSSIYIAMPISLLNFFGFHASSLNYSASLIVGLNVIIWTNDYLAYITGSWFGRHKFFVRISPGKTWEGIIGGFAFAMIAALIISVFDTVLSRTNWIVLAIIAVIAGTTGDLIESLLKRNMQVKDSGSILPGHGGALDRFDSLIFAIPFVFIYLIMI